jgi:4'-phosphopantetheinyl transferase
MTVALLEESDVHVWYRNTTRLDNGAEKSADQNLSVEERNRRGRFRFATDRRDYTLAHDLLRRTLSRYANVLPADWRFRTSEYGKPSIETRDPKIRALSFSLSSTRGWVACAIGSNALVGVDVERIELSHPVQDIADRYFSEKEAAWLRQSSGGLRSTRFAELWTLKEAFLKASGVGFFGSLTAASFRLDEHPCIEISKSSGINPDQWHFALFEPHTNLRLGIVARTDKQPRFITREDESDDRTLRPIYVSASPVKNTGFGEC